MKKSFIKSALTTFAVTLMTQVFLYMAVAAWELCLSDKLDTTNREGFCPNPTFGTNPSIINILVTVFNVTKDQILIFFQGMRPDILQLFIVVGFFCHVTYYVAPLIATGLCAWSFYHISHFVT